MNTVSTEARIQTVCLIILSTISIGVALYWLSPILIPFVLAIFFTYSLTPVIEMQMRHLRIPRLLALTLTILVGCVILALLSMLITTTINEMSTNIGTYKGQIKDLFIKFMEKIPLEWFGIQSEELNQSLSQMLDKNIASVLTSTFGGIMNVISNGMLVLIFMIFMLIGKSSGLKSDDALLSKVEYHIKSYILTMVFISTLTGVLIGVIFYLIGVRYALMFGFFAFLLNFIPNIGSIIATILPIPVILQSADLSTLDKISAILLPGVVQFSIGNLLLPKMMGKSLDLHPIVVLIALIFFGMIWGIVGMFLATPITAVTRILLEKVEFTRPIAEIMAGRIDMMETIQE